MKYARLNRETMLGYKLLVKLKCRMEIIYFGVDNTEGGPRGKENIMQKNIDTLWL